MSLFGGIGGFNPLQMVSQVALGMATGGASLIVQMALQVATQVIKEIIQQVGQQMGLPQPMIDAAQGAFDMASGNPTGAAQEFSQAAQGSASLVANAGSQFNASPSEVGEGQAQLDQLREEQVMSMVKSANQDEEGNAVGAGAGRSRVSGGSWLMALARALGAQLNAAQNELERTMDGTNWKKADQVAEFQAQSQQFALFMNTATNVIKTVGEALSTMARKQ